MSAEDAQARAGGRRRLLLTAVPVVAFLVLAAVLYGGLRYGDPSIIPSALVGQPAPAFDLAPLDGLARAGTAVPGLKTADLATGEVTVVNVWASWCAPCREEHPQLMRLAELGYRVVGINYKDNPENARRFLGTLGDPFVAVGVDTRGQSTIDWGVYGVPETFVVDGAGIIRHKHVGPLAASDVDGAFKDAIDAAARPPTS